MAKTEANEPERDSQELTDQKLAGVAAQPPPAALPDDEGDGKGGSGRKPRRKGDPNSDEGLTYTEGGYDFLEARRPDGYAVSITTSSEAGKDPKGQTLGKATYEIVIPHDKSNGPDAAGEIAKAKERLFELIRAR